MLIDPQWDNTLATSWAASDQTGGTPGQANIAPPVAGPPVIAADEATTEWNGVVAGAWYQLEYTPRSIRPTGVPQAT